MTSTFALAGRSVMRILRRPDIVISSVIFPVLLLLTLHAVFSAAVEAFESGEAYGQRLVPGLLVGGVMFGSIGTGVGLLSDIDSGWLARIRSMPIPDAAPLAGLVLSEAVRGLLVSGVLVGLGSLFGFRFQAGWLAAVGFFVAACLISMAFSWIGIALATRSSSPESLAAPLNAVFLIMLFLSQGMVPLEAYPGWVQPIVRVNPATAFVKLLDRLARGGALVRPALIAAAWALALTVVCGTFAIRSLKQR